MGDAFSDFFLEPQEFVIKSPLIALLLRPLRELLVFTLSIDEEGIVHELCIDLPASSRLFFRGESKKISDAVSAGDDGHFIHAVIRCHNLEANELKHFDLISNRLRLLT